MTDALRARLADAVDVLADLDALLEARGAGLPPILLARALVKLDWLAARLARMRQALSDAAASPSGVSAARNAPQNG